MKNTILAIGLIGAGYWLFAKNKSKGVETPILSKIIK
jgi:hypothetical protein|tara:strand:+ start:1075 stop:1185 length:111 start_codon:yes stop_codon:yes gene_type:complete